MAAFTTVKKIGSGQTYTSLSTWESDAPVDYTTSEKWTAGTFTGTFTQGETVTGTGLTSGKFLDSDGSSYVSFAIVTGNSNTLVTLTGSTSLATCVVSVKSATGCIWQGQINAASDTFTGSTTRLTTGGGTTSSTAYLELTTATGASFRDGIGTSALQYNTSYGCSITNSGNGYQPCIAGGQNYDRFTKLQIQQTGTGSAIDSRNTGLKISFCILEGFGSNPPLLFTVASATMDCDDTIMIQRGSGISSIVYIGVPLGFANFTNVTMVCPNDLTPATNFVSGGTNYSTYNFKNCAMFGASGFTGTSAVITHTANYSNLSATGCTAITYNTSAFVNITDATRDFRTVSGGTLNAKVSYDASYPTDIIGTTRPTGAGASDPGCFQVAAAGGGGVVKTVDGLAYASVKTLGGTTAASIKTIGGAASQ